MQRTDAGRIKPPAHCTSAMPFSAHPVDLPEACELCDYNPARISFSLQYNIMLRFLFLFSPFLVHFDKQRPLESKLDARDVSERGADLCFIARNDFLPESAQTPIYQKSLFAAAV